MSHLKLQVKRDMREPDFRVVGEKIRISTRNIEPLMQSLRNTATSAESAAKAAEGLIGSSQRQNYDVAELLKELTRAAEAVRALASYLTENPDSLIKGRRMTFRQTGVIFLAVFLTRGGFLKRPPNTLYSLETTPPAEPVMNVSGVPVEDPRHRTASRSRPPRHRRPGKGSQTRGSRHASVGGAARRHGHTPGRSISRTGCRQE